MITSAVIRSLNVEEECEDDAIHSAFRYSPAFAIEVKTGLGVDSATMLIHFCTNSEGDNDMQPSDIKRLLEEALAVAVLED